MKYSSLNRMVLVLAMVLTAGMVQAVAIDMVPVGNPGNAADTQIMQWDGTTGYGSVGYIYNIGKYEVTAGQYTEFLNTVAKTDPYGLYDSHMWTSILGSQIRQTGNSGSFAYSVPTDYANRPVNYVSFWDAARFTNWLHNGQGTGDTETGAYTLSNSKLRF